MSVVVYTDLAGCMRIAATSGSLTGVIISTQAQNTRDVGSTPAVGAIFPIFITPTTLAIRTLFVYTLKNKTHQAPITHATRDVI